MFEVKIRAYISKTADLLVSFALRGKGQVGWVKTLLEITLACRAHQLSLAGNMISNSREFGDGSKYYKNVTSMCSVSVLKNIL
jgi:hypothetical protein